MLVQTEMAFFFEVTKELCKRLELPKQKVVEYLSLFGDLFKGYFDLDNILESKEQAAELKQLKK